MPDNVIAQIDDFSITQFVDIEAYNRTTGYLDFKINEPQDLTITSGETTTENKGKNGRTILIKKSDKTLTGTGTNGVISAGLMLAQTGGNMTVDTHSVKKSELKVVGSTNKIITDRTAIGTAGDEIGIIKTLANNGAVTATYTQAAIADATHFAYNPTTKEITLPISDGTAVIPQGTSVLYSYTRNQDGTKITDPSDKFSETKELWIHCFGTDSCDNEYYAAIVIPRCSFTGEFNLALGGDQTVQNFNFTALANACGSMGGNLFELIIYTDTSNTGVQGEYDITVSTALASGDSVTIAGVEYTYNSSATTAAAQAAEIYAALGANATVTTNYTLSTTGSTIKFIENEGKYGTGAPSVVRTGLTTGVVTSTTIRQGEAAD